MTVSRKNNYFVEIIDFDLISLLTVFLNQINSGREISTIITPLQGKVKVELLSFNSYF